MSFARDGFALVPGVVPATELPAYRREADRLLKAGAGARGVLDASPLFHRLAHDSGFCELAGAGAFPVRALLFDKSPDANWHVAWHQDTTIAVQERHELPGFGPWTMKSDLPHVRPPAELLDQLCTLRLHLDKADASNGALKVIPGSHRHGILPAAEMADYVDASMSGRGENGGDRRLQVLTPWSRPSPAGIQLCEAEAGDVLQMRPLILHASDKATAARHRRVFHVEYAQAPLSPPLAWASRV